MEQVLLAREVIVKFFKRFEVFILPLLKFALGYFVFSRIHSIGHVNALVEPFTAVLSPSLLNILFALLFTIMPMGMSWMLIILTITVQFSANLELAIAIFVFTMFIYLFYARMSPRESILILITILAFHFNIPYIVPIIVGLYFPITAAIPVTLGVFINAQIPIAFGLMSPAAAVSGGDMELTELLTELPGRFSEVYAALMSGLTVTQEWLFTSVIFAMVIVLVHFVSRQAIDYAKEISIALGCVMTIFGFIVAVLVTDDQISIGLMIFGTLICGVIAAIVRFFDGVLDYQRAEAVQFEDDNNYYHVRIVPKVIMTKSQRVVKRIRPQPETENHGSED
ncbi:MAG: hypothetical protein FWE05_12470 [Defluviitaleaceae bacterium]|nr:hypothetical protein [Defluviitaleaceae bacterium]